MKKALFILSLLAVCFTARAQMNTDRLTAIGRNALYFDDYVLSIQYFNQVIRLKPYLAEPYLYRAIAKIQLGDLQGAEKDCSRCIENSPFLPGAYYTRGFVYRGLEDYDAAERDFTEALTLAPDNKTYLLLRADVRSLKKDYDAAISDMDYLIRRDPQSPSLHFERGVIMMGKKDTLAALDGFTKACQYDGLNAANWSAKGVVNSMLDHEDEALRDLTQAINLGSKWAGDYINRGILHYRAHNYRGALADYDHAISLEPQNAHTYYNRGLLRQELGDYNRAIDDYNQALELDPDNTEIHYQRGVVHMQLRQWKAARADFDTLIAVYPYFLPSYYLAAQAATAQGDTKKAFLYRQTAADLEQQKDKIQAAQKQVNTDVQAAEAQPQKRDRKKEFSNRAAQNQQSGEDDERYQSATRGAVQNRYADVVNQPNIVLSYYAQQDPLRRTAYYHYAVDDFNRHSLLPSPLRFTLQELALTADMVNRHFDQISQLSLELERYEEYFSGLRSIANLPASTVNRLAHLFFARSVEFALVQDYNSAIEDCNKAIFYAGQSPERTIMYFCRANWRYKLLEYQRISGDEISSEYLKLEFEIILRDYDQVILAAPDFAFAYYNKANILCAQHDYAAAIAYYSAALDADKDFAEAYFNRGLTRIYIDKTDEGLSDLSKAGELGIYQAYNLISRFR